MFRLLCIETYQSPFVHCQRVLRLRRRLCDHQPQQTWRTRARACFTFLRSSRRTRWRLRCQYGVSAGRARCRSPAWLPLLLRWSLHSWSLTATQAVVMIARLRPRRRLRGLSTRKTRPKEAPGSEMQPASRGVYGTGTLWKPRIGKGGPLRKTATPEARSRGATACLRGTACAGRKRIAYSSQAKRQTKSVKQHPRRLSQSVKRRALFNSVNRSAEHERSCRWLIQARANLYFINDLVNVFTNLKPAGLTRVEGKHPECGRRESAAILSWPVHSLGRDNSLYVRVRPSSRHSQHDWCHQSRRWTQESKELFLLRPELFRAFCT